MAEDHFILYLMLMSILGFTLGFIGILVFYVALSWQRVGTFVLDMLSLGAT